MNLSLDFLDRCSAESGFQVAALEKVARLGEFARAVAAHPLLGEALLLKGGTALHLGFGAPVRLSVDLDYNYVQHANREEMLADRPTIQKAVSDLSSRLGYHVQESSPEFSGTKFYLAYRSATDQTDRIEVDLNYLFRVPFSGTEKRSLWQPATLDRPIVQTVGISELLIGKLLAFLDRCAVRDVWDVSSLPDSLLAIANSQTFRRLFIAFAVTLPHPLHTYTLSRIEKLVTPKAISNQLLPLLMTRGPIDLTSLLSSAWKNIESLLNPDDIEKEYLSSLDLGDLQPALLFPDDPSLAKLVQEHPAIQWKLRNVREFLGKRH
jgi:predicted nucleotidyltransferase component of viral defense system